MPTRALSQAAEDTLKAIWSAAELGDRPLTTNALARALGSSASTVSEAVRKLADASLVAHEKYGEISLTGRGRAVAVDLVRKHRLIETFLVARLGYSWDEVHAEAEVLEHAVSRTFIDRLDDSLGNPSADPHGDPIPTSTGSMPRFSAVPLPELAPGRRATVTRVRDADAELLRYLTSVGIALGSRVELVEAREFAGTVLVSIDDAPKTVELGLPAAEAIWVE